MGFGRKLAFPFITPRLCIGARFGSIGLITGGGASSVSVRVAGTDSGAIEGIVGPSPLLLLRPPPWVIGLVSREAMSNRPSGRACGWLRAVDMVIGTLGGSSSTLGILT